MILNRNQFCLLVHISIMRNFKSSSDISVAVSHSAVSILSSSDFICSRFCAAVCVFASSSVSCSSFQLCGTTSFSSFFFVQQFHSAVSMQQFLSHATVPISVSVVCSRMTPASGMVA